MFLPQFVGLLASVLKQVLDEFFKDVSRDKKQSVESGSGSSSYVVVFQLLSVMLCYF